MKNYLIINIDDVTYGDTKNWLELTTYIPSYDINRKFSFSFSGVDIVQKNTSLNEKQIEKLKDILLDKFGYAPFNLEKAKEEKEKNYRIELPI